MGRVKYFEYHFQGLRITMFLWTLFCHISNSYKYHLNCVTKKCRVGCGKYNNCIDRNIPNKWYIQNKSCKSKICFFFSTGIHFHQCLVGNEKLSVLLSRFSFAASRKYSYWYHLVIDKQCTQVKVLYFKTQVLRIQTGCSVWFTVKTCIGSTLRLSFIAYWDVRLLK